MEQIINPMDATLVGPKYHYANQIRELFKLDPEISLSFDELKCKIDIQVDNEIKCLAIRKLLPVTKTFSDGNVTIDVCLRPDRFGGPTFLKDTVYEAFKGNPLFDYQYWWSDSEATTNPFCWVVMNPKVVAYPESNLHQIYGYSVELPEDLATAIIPDQTDCIFFCTNVENAPIPDHDSRKFNS